VPTDWNFDPAVILALVLLLGGYFALIGPLRTRLGGPWLPPRRAAAFVAGWALLALTLLSPLDTLGRNYLFTAHALQVLIITTAVAPLLMAGIPEWVVWRALPLRALRDATRSIFFPLLAVLLFNGLVLLWHIPPLLDASLRNLALHNLSNLSFLIAGVVTWWPLLTPLDRHTRLASPFQIFYVAAESLPLDIFGIFLMFTSALLYTAYASAPRLFGLSPLVDQQIAGGLLVIPGNLVDLIFMSVAFFGWINRVEQLQREREQAEADRQLAETSVAQTASDGDGA
jgi:putative membrane protein